MRVRRIPQPRQWIPALYSLVLTLVILGPLLGPGYLLLRDAVSTPRSYLTDSALGISDAAPRAVPQDALLAVASSIVDGGILVKAILLLSLWAAGYGAAKMVRTVLPAVGLGGQLVAITVALWNPFVAERLLQGHWSLLTGYAALPWIVSAAVSMRRGGSAGALLVALASAGLTPTGAVLAGLLAVILAALPGGRRRARRLLIVVAALAAVAAPWLVAAVLGGGAGSDPAGVAAFAARAEPGLGTLGSLAGLGGIWNSLAVPGSRTTLFALASTALLLALVAAGLRGLWRRRRNPVIAALVVIAVLAIVLPALAATGPGLALCRAIVAAVPGSGLGRDAQKWVALAMPGYVLAAALAADRLRARRPKSATPKSAKSSAVALCALLILALPDLAWGVGGALRPAHYPVGWAQVAQLAAPGDGDVAVLPAGSFRMFDGGPVVLDPAARWLQADVLDPGALIVGGVRVAGEGSRAQSVLLSGAEPAKLAELGVRWVLVEHGTPGDLGASATTLAKLEPFYADADLSLYRVPGSVEWAPASQAARATAIAAHLLWLAVLACGLGCGVVRDLAKRRSRRGLIRDEL
ncbi:hypothetical protein [Tomitella biformata]|uniref:hypothetical protein n=1 Tax=Tomitella biformata TaxID=630403 RepID=UPI0004658294|nr:hypothetical protein [Tomitella biformata]